MIDLKLCLLAVHLVKDKSSYMSELGACNIIYIYDNIECDNIVIAPLMKCNPNIEFSDQTAN